MVAWIMMLLVMFEGVDGDYTYPELLKSYNIEQAREAYKAQLVQLELQKAIVEEKKQVEVSLKWDTVVSQAPQQHYLVTGPNCVYCEPRKRYLKSQGIAFTEISVEQARAAPYNRIVTAIPAEFDMALPTTSAVCEASCEPTTHAALSILANHLLAQQSKDAMGSLLEFDIDTPDALPSIITQLMTKQKWTNGVVSVNWSGNRSISVQPEKIIFNPPPSVRAVKGIFSYSTSLRQISVRNQGKQLEIELTTCPNLIINFK